MAAKQVPPPITEGGQRIAERPYESAFARLPADEVHALSEPGAGPRGSLDDAPRNWPLATIVIGFAVLFVNFGAAQAELLIAGLALIVVGAVWGLVRARPLRLRRGVGTVRLRQS